MNLSPAIKNPVYTECWNCGHKEWWNYNDPKKTKPKFCLKCGKRFMSKEDKFVVDYYISNIKESEKQ